MHGMGRERGQTDGDVFCAFVGSGVLDPLAGTGYDGLTGYNVEASITMANAPTSAKDDGLFLEFRSLTRLFPPGRAVHVGHAQSRLRVAHAAHILVDDLGQIARSLHTGRALN